MKTAGETIAVAVLAFIGLFVLIIGSSILMAFPTKWLWNWLMPYLFGLPEINIWKALGINLLSSFLFRSSASIKKI